MAINNNQNSDNSSSKPHLLQAPLLHFFALALIAFALFKSTDQFDFSSIHIGFLAKPQVITLSDEEIFTALEENKITIDSSNYLSSTLSESKQEKLAAAIGELIDNAILYDQGIEAGLALNDALIIDRMMKNIETLADKSACASSGCDEQQMSQLLDEAIEVEVFETDPVIRKRVIQLMEQHLRLSEVITHPKDENLEEYIQSNPDQFSQPLRITFEQLFFSTRQAAEEFQQGKTTQSQNSILPQEMVLASETKITQQYGKEFSQALVKALDQRAKDGNTAIGPLKSAFGYHLITLKEVRAARLANLDEVYNRAFIGWLEAEKSQSHRRAIARLRKDYQIRTENLGPVAITRFPSLWLQGLSNQKASKTISDAENELSSLDVTSGSGV